jgi:hypothetical protein
MPCAHGCSSVFQTLESNHGHHLTNHFDPGTHRRLSDMAAQPQVGLWPQRLDGSDRRRPDYHAAHRATLSHFGFSQSVARFAPRQCPGGGWILTCQHDPMSGDDVMMPVRPCVILLPPHLSAARRPLASGGSSCTTRPVSSGTAVSQPACSMARIASL